MYRVADGEYRRWLKVTVRSLGLLIDWNWDASVQRKVRGLAVSGPVVLVTANLFTWLFEHSNINCIVRHVPVGFIFHSSNPLLSRTFPTHVLLILSAEISFALRSELLLPCHQMTRYLSILLPILPV